MSNDSSGSKSIQNVRKKLTYTHDLLYSAHHEAGHVIISLISNMFVNEAQVLEHKKYKRIIGFCDYESFKELDDIADSALLNKQLKLEICVC